MATPLNGARMIVCPPRCAAAPPAARRPVIWLRASDACQTSRRPRSTDRDRRAGPRRPRQHRCRPACAAPRPAVPPDRPAPPRRRRLRFGEREHRPGRRVVERARICPARTAIPSSTFTSTTRPVIQEEHRGAPARGHVARGVQDGSRLAGRPLSHRRHLHLDRSASAPASADAPRPAPASRSGPDGPLQAAVSYPRASRSARADSEARRILLEVTHMVSGRFGNGRSIL